MIPQSKFLSAFLLILMLTVSYSKASRLVSGDSIGIERVGDKTFILHKVTPQETLFAISRKYQVPVGEIQNANEVLKQGLKIGQTIRVPYFEKSKLPEGAALHKVNPGETLFSISKKYGVSVDSLKQWNKLLGNDLSVGQALIVKEAAIATNSQPTPVAPTVAATTTAAAESVTTAGNNPKTESKPVEKKAEKPSAEKPTTKAQPETVLTTPSTTVANTTPIAPGEWISHTVKQGETLFSLSTQYNSSVEDLIKWNALTSNNLRSGQVIKVGRAPEGPSTVPVIGSPKVATSTAEMNVEPTVANTSGGFKNITETGQAELIEGTGSHKKYLVLHRTAPVGSIMRVKNEENDLTIFARVVGTLPETGDNSKLVIKLSQAAFDQLKAVNQRFPVEVLY
ncbi:LysM peptidoglycan-binding domain-containing protein [Algoriphagus aestuariicola]|uniref:LysM peptidoglycan-binding domain-containing protein n=1 Tax=Algoriphagus aestuariicola TaxID=1852016 RepID=A0ABS3BP21_9BACT|nr:LysM peptidoglycan-binding domain-containing protein [Algoriphagus aestuariicola]MBN7801011.1 LysM peptidoglycan-binding domain-containing protein [Algoriphagus aestuariicola]